MACASGRGTDWGARSIIQEVGCGKDGFNRHVFSIFSATVADLPVNPSIFPARNPATPFLLQRPPVGRRPESLAQVLKRAFWILFAARAIVFLLISRRPP